MTQEQSLKTEMRRVLRSFLRTASRDGDSFSQPAIDRGYFLLKVVALWRIQVGRIGTVLRRFLHFIDHFGSLSSAFLAEARHLAKA